MEVSGTLDVLLRASASARTVMAKLCFSILRSRSGYSCYFCSPLFFVEYSVTLSLAEIDLGCGPQDFSQLD